ncbi:ABC transporter permease family protein [Tabrizicola fusiformis]|uniref:hypothetical protein n=1 Tax=Tabrizicola sp. SY72 TaxID=2741673 RepID=UPI001F507D22|nr:hypothetical protein [Tabrizicola sp. SY72]
MLGYVTGRFRNAAILLVLASMLCFGLVVSAPGNVAVLIAELRTPGATFAQIAEIEEELGLNELLPTRYWHWLSGVPAGISASLTRPERRWARRWRAGCRSRQRFWAVRRSLPASSAWPWGFWAPCGRMGWWTG